MKKIFLKLLIITISIFIGIVIYFYFSYPIVFQPQNIETFHPEKSKEQNQILSATQVNEDIQNLISVVESTHPSFLNNISDNYYSAKTDLLSYCDNSVTVQKLQYEISKYLSSLNDLHTCAIQQISLNRELNVKWQYIDDKLYLLDQDNLSKKEVLKIGNVPIQKVIQEILCLYPAENIFGINYNIEFYSKQESFLKNIGIQNTDMVEIQYVENNQVLTLDCQYIFLNNARRSYTEKLSENLVYISLSDFNNTTLFQNILNQIQTYIIQGVDHYIIDVRNNPGGKYEMVKKLLAVFDVEPLPTYSILTRFSPLASEKYGYIRKKGSVLQKGNNTIIQDLRKQIYILIDESSASAAQALAVSLQDANAATIIGRPSSNNTSFYGNAAPFQLKNSKIVFQVSTSYYIRPDKDKIDKLQLESDIYVERKDDILETALKYIKEGSK